jgi:integrase
MASLKKRGKRYYEQYYVGRKKVTKSLGTSSLQIAKEKVRQHESARFRGEEAGIPTKTPIAKVVGDFVRNLFGKKRARNAGKDLYYLREAFGPVCPELQIKNAKISRKGKKRPSNKAPKVIEASYFEWVRTADIAAMIADQVRCKGIKGKSANHFRQILVRLYNWAMKEGGVTMPGKMNPAAAVERYTETTPPIRYLTLAQIDAQLRTLAHVPILLVMVAVYIYAGLRREELFWLTLDDMDFKAGRYGVIRVRAKEIAGEYWQPKTGKNRVVPISKKLRGYLDAYTPVKVEGHWFFPSPESRRWDPDNFSEWLREMNKEAGLLWTCLDYRHTFGSQLAMRGVSLFKISELMGNSPEICRKHYAHLNPGSLVDSVEFGETDFSTPAPVAPASASPSSSQDRLPRAKLRLVVTKFVKGDET